MDHLVHHFLGASALRHPDKEALVHRDRRLSFRDLDVASDRLARALVEGGVRRMDRVAVFLDKSVEEVLAFLAASKAGGVFVPINGLLFPEQVEHILRDCAPRALVTTVRRLRQLGPVLDRIEGLDTVVLADDSREVAEIAGSRAIVDLPRIVEDASIPDGPPAIGNISQDLAAILYTSGSTGRPKGVMLSHANLLAGSRIVSTYLEIDGDDRILSVLPFSFDYGLNQLVTGLEHGATVILLTFRFPGEVVKAIAEERVTGLAGVPSFWTVLTQPGSPVHKQDLPTLRYITNSGGHVAGSLLAALRKALPTTRVYLMYGLTEAFRSTYLPPDELDRRPGSMGKAIPDTEIFVLDDDGRPCAAGEPGELVHRGPTVSLGYWGRPEETAKVLRPNPLAPPQIDRPELVCYSGDLVKTDEEGFLYFLGRRDATIKCAGFRISPNEVEEVLLSTGMVREAAAIGVADDLMGQSVLAVVVPADGEAVDRDRLLAACSERMPRYMVPRRVHVLEQLPKTAHGKIDYPELRRRAPEWIEA